MKTSDTKLFLDALKTGKVNIVDLTHTLNEEFPTLTLPPQFGQTWSFRKENISAYDEKGPAWYWNNFSCGEHTGTHFDAPAHWITGKEIDRKTVDKIAIENFVGEAVVINASAEVSEDENWNLTKDFLLKWESEHGCIPEDAWVLLRTDWSHKIGDPQKFANLVEGRPNTPGPTQEAVEWLINERKVRGFGVETINIDAGLSFDWSVPYPCHNLMLGAGKFGLQCLNNLDKLPARDVFIVSAPLKIEDGSGSPLRVLALF